MAWPSITENVTKATKAFFEAVFANAEATATAAAEALKVSSSAPLTISGAPAAGQVLTGTGTSTAAFADPAAATGGIVTLGLGQLSFLSTPTVAVAGNGGHQVAVTPDGKHVYVVATEAAKVQVYKRDAVTGLLTSVEEVAAGAEADGICISPDGRHVYVANTGAGTISCFKREASNGKLTLQESKACTKARNIAITPDGKHVYATNSAATEETVSGFTRNTATGALTLVEASATAGKGPRGVAVSPDGKNVYTANWTTGNISQFERDPATGKLTALEPATLASAVEVDLILVSPDGKSVYATQFASNAVQQFQRNTDGTLTLIGTVATGQNPTDLEVSADGSCVYVCCFNAGLVFEYKRINSYSPLVPMTTPSIDDGNPLNETEGIAISPDQKHVYVVSWQKILAQYARQLATPVATPGISSTSRIVLTAQDENTVGALGVVNKQPGVGFSIRSDVSSDNGKVAYELTVPELSGLALLSPKNLEAGEEPQHPVVSPDGKHVYLCCAKGGVLSCYSRGAGGVLTPLGTRDVVCAAGTYDAAISPNGKHVYVCNRDAVGAKSISQFSRNESTGVLTPLSTPNVELKGGVTGSSEGSVGGGPHSIVISNDGKFVYLCTQSKPGKVYQFKRDTTTGLLTALSPELLEFAEPNKAKMIFDLRLSTDAEQRHAYGTLLGALNSAEQGQIVAYDRDPVTGLLTQKEVVSSGTGALCSGACAVSPDNKNLYVTNKEPIPTSPEGVGANEHGISVFTIGAEGKLTFLEFKVTYEEPRGVWCAPDGLGVLVCDQGGKGSNHAYIHVFDREPNTGKLTFKEASDPEGGTGSHNLWPSHGVVSPDGASFYSGDKDGTAKKGNNISEWSLSL